MTEKEYPGISEKLYSATLPNGLPVYIVPKPGYKRKFAYLAVKFGALDRQTEYFYPNEPELKKQLDLVAGTAHFLEHKAFETKQGCALTALSANGALPNAYTSFDTTAYFFECADNFYENLKILLEFVYTPCFSHDSIAKEKEVILQEIHMANDDPDNCLFYGMMHTLFPTHPICEPILGTVESIASITAQSLSLCHEVFYTPGNMVLCVCGDVNPEEVCDIAADVISPYEPVHLIRNYGDTNPQKTKASDFRHSMNVNLPIFLYGCKTKAITHGKQKFTRELLAGLSLEVLAGSSSKLYSKLYAQGLINTDFSATFDIIADVAFVLFGGESHSPHQVFDLLNEEISSLTTGVDTELFSGLKKMIVGSNVRTFNSFSSICSGLAHSFFYSYDMFDRLNILSSFTEDDVISFIKENLQISEMSCAVINPTNHEYEV